jgi:hypothetical protein
MNFVERLIDRKIRKPARAAVRRAVTRWCPECQKQAELFHTCEIKTDFRSRRRTAERRTRTVQRRQSARDAAGRRKERLNERRKLTAADRRAGRAHPYQECTDRGCRRPQCLAYKEGIANCPLEHI